MAKKNIEETSIVHSQPTEWPSTQFVRKKTEIDGCYIIDPLADTFCDERGANWEVLHDGKFQSIDLMFVPKQINKTISNEGVFRGLHFQYQYPQGKIVTCIAGKALVIVLDTRINSPTFGQVVFGIIEPTCGLMIYAPKGVAHGFLALEKHTHYLYLCDDVYHPEEGRGITYEDRKILPVIKRYSPFTEAELIVNQRDREFPTLEEAIKKGDYLPFF